VLGLAASLAAPISGHFQADTVARTQPAKLAAFEGHFQSGPADLYLLGVPDVESGTVRAGVAVPGLLSLLVHGRADAPVPGLDAFPREDWPPVGLSFQTYHLMVALGGFFLAVTAYAAWRLRRGTLWRARWLLWTFGFAVGGAFVANQAGWVAAEVGRQPWVVYGLLRTSDGISKAVQAGQVATSIVMFLLIYTLLFAVWVFVLNDKIQHGPEMPPPRGEGAGRRGLLEAAGSLAAHGEASLTAPERRS